MSTSFFICAGGTAGRSPSIPPRVTPFRCASNWMLPGARISGRFSAERCGWGNLPCGRDDAPQLFSGRGCLPRVGSRPQTMNSLRPKARSQGSERWLILGIHRNRGRTAVRVAQGSPIGVHAARLADPERTDCEVVFVAGPDVEPLLEASLDALLGMMEGARRPALILLPWKAPPEWELRFDGQVRSFGCGRATFRSLVARAAERPVEGLCFALLDDIMNQRLAVDRLAVRQLPYGAMTGREACPTMSLIMAHRGRRQYLSTALRYISRAIGPNVRPRIGLDEDEPTAYASIAAHYPEAQFFRLVPAGAGPYVVRQELARRSKEPLLVFHDSDDVSCYDRFVRQEELLRSAGCDLVGCHELRVDEMEKEVTAIRFP